VRTVVALCLASCAAQGSAAVAARSQKEPSDGDQYDPCDVCLLADVAHPENTEDGCTRPEFVMTDGCVLSRDQEAFFSRGATELVANAHLTTVRLVSGKAACASAVRSALELHGVPPGRVEIATRGSDPSVFVEVGAWDGKRCP
jgi:hypothetical protein